MHSHALPPYLKRNKLCTRSLQWLVTSDSSSSASATKSGLTGLTKVTVFLDCQLPQKSTPPVMIPETHSEISENKYLPY